MRIGTSREVGRQGLLQDRGNPVASPVLRGYLACAQMKLRRIGVAVKQAPPCVADQLRDMRRNRHRRAQMLSTAQNASRKFVTYTCSAWIFHTATNRGCKSGLIHEVVTGRGVTGVVPGRSRRRVEWLTGINPVPNNHQSPAPFAGGEM